MERLTEFYEWYKSRGGDVNKCNYLDISRELNSVILKATSFKWRAKEIKEKYNYQFS